MSFSLRKQGRDRHNKTMEAFREVQNFGQYQLHAKIANGGMAEVLLGTTNQPAFQGQFLAIKRLLPHLNSNKPFVNLLIHEAKIGVLLTHPSIAAVYDLGSYKSEFFLAMEYVHGKSLDHILERIKSKAAPKLSLELSTYIILEILRAIAFAHELKDSKDRELNIIHRDVSPGNILLGYRGEVKLTDFGIATAESRLQPGFSQNAMGKLAYISPEQAVNEAVTRASDLYSIGILYYELLTGQLPFQADSAQALFKKIVDGRMTDIRILGPTIPQELRDIIVTCLNKAARKRYQSAPELYQVIHQFFSKKFELDFTAKATRQYYKKKLMEYLRSVFELEMIQELEVIQRAVQQPSAELKVTAPHDLRNLAAMDRNLHAEVTVFEQDYGDEATRHYPLSEEERKKILQGLPAREVIQSVKAPGKGFDLATIPEYDLAADVSFQKSSARDRLEKSNLNRDEKENLKEHLPQIEISTSRQLEAFEQSTLSGKAAPKDPDATREMSREQILRDFSVLEASGGPSEDLETEKQPAPDLSDETTPRTGLTPTREPSSKIEPVIQHPTSKITARVNRMSAIYRQNIATFAWVIGGIFAAVTLIALVTWFLFYSQGLMSLFRSQAGLFPTETVELVFLGEGSEESQKTFVRMLNEQIPSLAQIEELFNREYARYTNDTRPALKLIYRNPTLVPQPLSNRLDITEIVRTPRIFEAFGSAIPKNLEPTRTYLFVYLYPYDSPSEITAFPEELLVEHPERRGVTFFPMHPSQRMKGLLSIAREIGFLFGAQDKRDQVTLMPLLPEGIANPNEHPLFPQSKAELMGRDIPTGPLIRRPANGFHEMMIGPQSAYEMGWINLDKKNKLMKPE